jgi:hypothetical protein
VSELGIATGEPADAQRVGRFFFGRRLRSR